MSRTPIVGLIVALTATGCFLDRTGASASGLDASAPPDAGGGGLDAGAIDAGPPPLDAEPPPDAGAPADAGDVMDAGGDDAGPGGEDAGPGVDAGAPDAGPGSTVPLTMGLIVHFDAQNVSGVGVPTPAEMPGTWVDLTGGNDASCNQVTWDPDGLATGYPSMFTDGNVGSSCEFDIPELNDLTIFVVFRNSDTREDGGNWYHNAVMVGGDAPGGRDDAALYWADGRVGFARRDGGFQYRYPTSYADDMPHVVALAREGSSGTVLARVDRDVADLGTADSGPIRDPGNWWLASHANPNDGRFANHYAEVLIYDRALTGPEIDVIREYLFARWGI